MTRPQQPRRSTGDKLAAAASTPSAERIDGVTEPRNPVPTEPRNPVVVKFTIDLDRDLHRSLKMLALDTGTPATRIVRAALELTFADAALRALVQSRARAVRSDGL